jgi:hypothetical protein
MVVINNITLLKIPLNSYRISFHFKRIINSVEESLKADKIPAGQKLQAFYGRFIMLCSRARQLSLSWANWIPPIPPHIQFIFDSS